MLAYGCLVTRHSCKHAGHVFHVGECGKLDAWHWDGHRPATAHIVWHGGVSR
jgi:hypothetical protein